MLGGIHFYLGVSADPMFLWISLNSCPLNLLLVRSHQAEIIIVKRLIQGRNNVTRVWVVPRSCDQGRRKNGVLTLSTTLPTGCFVPRASPGQNSEAAHPANRKRRLLGTRHGRPSVLSCLTFGSCRIGLPLAAPSGNHACWDFFLLAFLVPEDFLNWLE